MKTMHVHPNPMGYNQPGNTQLSHATPDYTATLHISLYKYGDHKQKETSQTSFVLIYLMKNLTSLNLKYR